jgi:hypothetical protein
MTKLKGRVKQCGYYHDGDDRFERLEIRLKKDALTFLGRLPCRRTVRDRSRDISLVVGGRSYRAGLRSRKGEPDILICPDLTGANDEPVRLADILREQYIGKREDVEIKVSGTTFVVTKA